jgi:hypothetical protein
MLEQPNQHSSFHITYCRIFDATPRVGDEHIVQPRAIVLDELDTASQPIGRL